MTNNRDVIFSLRFTRDVKRLKKRYPHIAADLRSLLDILKRGETPGDHIQGIGYTVYKVRLVNTDAQKGKRGGYRVIYYLQTAALIILVAIYTKSDREDVSSDDLRRWIEESLTNQDVEDNQSSANGE